MLFPYIEGLTLLGFTHNGGLQIGFGSYAGQHLHLLGEDFKRTVDTKKRSFGWGTLVLLGSMAAMLTWAAFELEWIPSMQAKK